MIKNIITAIINSILTLITILIIAIIGVKFFADSIIFYLITIITFLLAALFHKIANTICDKMIKTFEDFRLL